MTCSIPTFISRLPLLAVLLAFSASVLAQGYRTELSVALDGSGNFRSIQDAIDAAKSYPSERITIHVKNGIYREKVEVPAWNTMVSLVGESREGTVITFDDSFDTIGRGRNSTFHTYTLKVSGNDFHAENLTVVNSAGPGGQAVALHVEADRAAFVNVTIDGFQDTLYVAGEGFRSYFRDCRIAGSTDFIFGSGTALFENCEIRSLENSYITAASTPENQSYGLVFRNCRLTAKPGVDKVYLGRPWREHAKTVFIDSELGAHIVPEGWHNWGRETNESTAFFAEYGNRGPGSDTGHRVPWSKQLSDQAAGAYTKENMFGDWNPSAGYGQDAALQILLAGDSTMAAKEPGKRPETGWGEMLQPWFDEKSVVVRNHAKNGRSTRTFIEEGRWDALLERVRPGDYVFIQFGHNDQSVRKTERYTPPDQYRANLMRFVADVRARGGRPVLFTPVVRRRFDGQGMFYDSHGEYPGLVREVAEATGAPLVDMEDSSRALLVEHGPEASKKLYLFLQPGESENYPEGLEDNTHFSPDGARAMAALVFQDIRHAVPELAGKLSNHGPPTVSQAGADIAGNTRQLAFPGAEGFGRHAVGGRGGRVIKVTSLDDDGPGSLRQALREEGPRTVVFDVSGTIPLEREIVVKNGFLTIAGQTAPGGGITLKNHGLVIKADDVIVRYIRSRPGSEKGVETDAISIGSGHDIIIDHCSTSWATDETLTVSPWERNTLRSIDNVTVQWSMITESLNDSVHSKGKHGYGSLVRGSGGARYSFHHNLWAHHKARMPRPGNYFDAKADPQGPLFDFRNNVFYNWGGAASGYNADTDSVSRYNFVNNYYLRGQDSKKDLAFDESNSLADAHFSGNFMNGELPGNQWELVRYEDGRKAGSDTPFPAAPVRTQPAPEAYRDVLRFAGASLERDSVDRRVVEHVENGAGRIIDDVSEVGGWPLLKSLPPAADTDNDGMPDEWERSQGLDPENAADGIGDPDGDGYTNLEGYLNGLASAR